MRDIKFRAWDIANREMNHLPNHGIDLFQLLICEDGWCIEFDNSEDDKRYYDEKDFVLMQYTSLKDKNGREIYEGDIILSPEDNNAQREVVFQDGMFGAMVPRKLYGEEGCENVDEFQPLDTIIDYNYWKEKPSFTVEVIGNIHENPELLK
jgi:uncharacterized phage protein (TIGR01671 family)